MSVPDGSVPGGSVWDDLVGQEAAVAVLREAAAAAARAVGAGRDAAGTGAMTHAWLFAGPPGSGRSVAARAFAAALQCDRQGCGGCTACRTTLLGTSADLDVVIPSGLSISVDEARTVVRRAALAPTGGRWQVTLVEDADRLTEAAANALLKALEEPPARAVFLLCVPSVDDLPPTVRSRCRLVSLRTPSSTSVAEVLARRDGIDPAVAAFAARAAQGHVGRARRLATDESARTRRREVLALPRSLGTVGAALGAARDLVEAAQEEGGRITGPLDAAESASLQEALGAGATGKGMRGSAARGGGAAVKDLERRQRSRGTRSQRDALDRALVDLAAYYRDVLALQLGSSVDPVHADLSAEVGALAGSSTPESTLRRIDAVLACRDAIGANVAPLLAVEAMALRLRQG